jgi:hypothetical protein
MKPNWEGLYGEQWTRERQAMELGRNQWPVNESPAENHARDTLLMAWPAPQKPRIRTHRRPKPANRLPICLYMEKESEND